MFPKVPLRLIAASPITPPGELPTNSIRDETNPSDEPINFEVEPSTSHSNDRVPDTSASPSAANSQDEENSEVSTVCIDAKARSHLPVHEKVLEKVPWLRWYVTPMAAALQTVIWSSSTAKQGLWRGIVQGWDVVGMYCE